MSDEYGAPFVFGIDRKSVVQGKSVDLGGCRIIKKKKKKKVSGIMQSVYIIVEECRIETEHSNCYYIMTNKKTEENVVSKQGAGMEIKQIRNDIERQSQLK